MWQEAAPVLPRAGAVSLHAIVAKDHLLTVIVTWLKLFNASNVDHVKYCEHRFSSATPSDLWQKNEAKRLSSHLINFVSTIVEFLLIFVCLI